MDRAGAAVHALAGGHVAAAATRREAAATTPARSAALTTAAADTRQPGGVGRIARLELVFARRGGRTVLAHAYAEPPLRAGRVFPHGDGLHMILTMSAPGIFAGDQFEQTIVVEAGAQVRLSSQSSLQVHGGAGAAARWRGQFTVGAGATLQCHWHPVIPFAGARLVQRNRVDLSADATLIWADGLMSGRVARGERWAFDQLSSELRIARADGARHELEYLERYDIRPSAGRSPAERFVAGGASHIATMVASGPEVEPRCAEPLHRELSTMAGVRAAVDALNDRTVLVRMTAETGPAFYRARAAAAERLSLVPTINQKR